MDGFLDPGWAMLVAAALINPMCFDALQGNVWVVFGLFGPNGAVCIGGLLTTVVCWR